MREKRRLFIRRQANDLLERARELGGLTTRESHILAHLH